MMKLIPNLLLLILTACTLHPTPRPPLPQSAFESPIATVGEVWRVYLVKIDNQLPSPTPTPKPPDCMTTPQAREFAELLRNDPRQQRKVMVCDPRLVAAAQQRAESLARLGYWSHCDPSGVCPNQVVVANGCSLPAFYPTNGNNTESIVAGTPHAQAAYDALMRSPAHAAHLLGLRPFYANQNRYGVAFVDMPGARWRYYWVIEIAICG